jgi:hypothetical protein
MRKNLLYSAAILLALSSQALADGAPSAQGQPAANAAAPASGTLKAVEVPQFSSQGPKGTGEGGEVKADTGAAGIASTGAETSRAFASGVWCIGYFGSKTFRLSSRGRVLYRVVPTTFFDVTMRVTYVNLRSFFVDRFLAPGAESILISGPSVWWPVKVIIRGYRGQAGCFRLFAG